MQLCVKSLIPLLSTGKILSRFLSECTFFFSISLQLCSMGDFFSSLGVDARSVHTLIDTFDQYSLLPKLCGVMTIQYLRANMAQTVLLCQNKHRQTKKGYCKRFCSEVSFRSELHQIMLAFYFFLRASLMVLTSISLSLNIVLQLCKTPIKTSPYDEVCLCHCSPMS